MRTALAGRDVVVVLPESSTGLDATAVATVLVAAATLLAAVVVALFGRAEFTRRQRGEHAARLQDAVRRLTEHAMLVALSRATHADLEQGDHPSVLHARVRAAAQDVYASAHTYEVVVRARVLVRTSYDLLFSRNHDETWWRSHGPVDDPDPLAAIHRRKELSDRSAASIMSAVVFDLARAARREAGRRSSTVELVPDQLDDGGLHRELERRGYVTVKHRDGAPPDRPAGDVAPGAHGLRDRVHALRLRLRDSAPTRRAGPAEDAGRVRSTPS